MKTKAEAPTRAAIYTRVSTDEQAENGTSLETQRSRCAAYIESKAWTVAGEYVDDGISGTKSSRPALDRMMQDCRDGNVDAVVFAKFDRFSRNRRHLENACAELDDLGVALVSVAENIDGSTATGQAFRALLGVFANLERDMIVERTSSGLRAIARAGYHPGGPPPFGFRLEPTDDRRHNVLAVDHAEAAIIEQVADLILEHGHGPVEAARKLNALAVPTARVHRGKVASALWTHTTVLNVLRNPALGGVFVYNRRSKHDTIDIPCPAILEPDRHARMLTALDARARGPRAKNHCYPLSARLVGTCGHEFYGAYRKDRDLRQYVCKIAGCSDTTTQCHEPRVSAEAVESAVWHAVTELLTDPARLSALHKAWAGDNPTGKRRVDPLAALDRRIADAQGALTRLVVDFAKQGLDPAALKSATEELETDLSALREHRTELAAAAEDASAKSRQLRRLEDLANTAGDRLATMTLEERKETLALLGVRVEITERASGRSGIPLGLRVEGSVGPLLDRSPGKGFSEPLRHLAPPPRRCGPGASRARTSQGRAG